MKTLLVIFTILVSAAAAASSAAPGEIPSDVKFQALNLAVFFGILIYFGGPKVVALFKQRNEDYHRVARETERAKKELEDQRADLVRRSLELRQNTEVTMAKAKTEAEQAMRDQVTKANEEVARLLADAQGQLTSEYSKLMEKLRVEALEMSLTAAEGKLESLDVATKTKVSSGFVSRVEGATV